jgi:N-acetylglucosamine malate deacetylase 1
MNGERLRVLVIGAHPDDPDICCGGTAVLWAAAGHVVKFVSTTSGDTGHQAIGGVELARRRQAEAQSSAKVAGIAEYQVLDNHTGELEPNVANRRALIRLIREFSPDLLLSHRPNDYHPDHRATGQLVMDSSYILTVPNMVALTDILPRQPVILSFSDTFTRPCPFQADVVVGIDEVIERKFDMVHCHVSQVYEWLPFNQGVLAEVPAGDADRRQWLVGQYRARFELAARRYRAKLVERYGEKRGQAFRFAEAFEVSEYGAQPDEKVIRRLFPFFG